MAEDEVVTAVTAKLRGEFYVGQHVRLKVATSHYTSKRATVVAINYHPVAGQLCNLQFDGDALSSFNAWHHSWLEPAE